uniref:Uncharacterized protein n=1 Tax=Anguilla anguilla TaxID=7936 RepID=A0A0E9PX60_ANGAN
MEPSILGVKSVKAPRLSFLIAVCYGFSMAQKKAELIKKFCNKITRGQIIKGKHSH